MTDHPGPTTLETDDGVRLGARWSGPADARAVAVLTHPHPLYGGDMDNIVPASLARTLPDHGIATVRFDFRGNGTSAGEHGGGEAEVADVRAAIQAAAIQYPGTSIVGVGYSFGADVLLATADARLDAVVAIAPPLAVLPHERLAAARGSSPTLVLAPEHDQFRPFRDAGTATAGWPGTTVVEIPGANHFMAGATAFAADEVARFVDSVLATG
jgi:alpha/beta superfamily hydrolase